MKAVCSALVVGIAIAALSPFPATARSGIDGNGDGLYSLEELRRIYPTLSALAFRRIDTNSDGLVSPGEFRRGQDEGLLPNAVEN